VVVVDERRVVRGLLSASVLLLTMAACGEQVDDARTATEPSAEETASVFGVEDDTGDVFSETSGERVSDGRNVDVVSTEVRRTANALTVAVTYDDIESLGSVDWMVDLLLVNPNGSRRQVTWNEYDDGAGAPVREVTMFRLTPDSAVANPCPGLDGSVDFDAETVTVTVPTRCFGDPASVEVKEMTATARGGHGDGEWYVDNPFGTNAAGGTSLPLERVSAGS
jgi:hypothetical protein